MATGAELKAISDIRLQEVKALYNNGLYDGAKYLSGYVVESALKARICKILDQDYPEKNNDLRSYLTHKFDVLIILAGLKNLFYNESNNNVNFKTNWSLVNDWKEFFRYQPVGTATQAEVRDVIIALEDPNDGILTWIKNKW